MERSVKKIDFIRVREMLLGLFVMGLFIFLSAGASEADETCNSCSDCSAKLNVLGNKVQLSQNLGPWAGSCIVIGASNVQFDCAGHTITGDNSGAGIGNNGYNNVTILNCKLTNFDVGIDLQNSSGNTLLNNEITDLDLFGIYLNNANDNTLDQNYVRLAAREGISIYNSTGNRLTFNEVCNSNEVDIRNNNGSPTNSGERNTCGDGSEKLKVVNWADEGQTAGCAYYCTSCGDYDHDGVCDSQDNCLYVPNNNQLDSDGDGVGDACDNCPAVYNPNQEHSNDLDNFGNACDNCWLVNNNDQGDSDGDCALLKLNPAFWNGTRWLQDPRCGNYCDNCPNASNPDQLDTDGDGDGDVCDNCKFISNADQADQDQDGIGNLCDNCWLVANSGQKNTDSDNYGDACDKCPTMAWVSNDDRDGDGVGDACDNCPDHPNPNQEDINNNAVGNACDCFDVLQGAHETGVDCGGVCGPCVNCTWCDSTIVPLRLAGSFKNKADIVFVPEQNYQGSLPQFLDDVRAHIRNGYFRLDQSAIDPIPSFLDRFNFYYYNAGFGTWTSDGPCAGELPGEAAHDNWAAWCITLCASFWPFGCACMAAEPNHFWGNAPFTDMGAILFNSLNGPGCTNKLGPPSHMVSDNTVGTVMHESAHGLFGLVDEYCGKTHYEQPQEVPNVWSSLANCLADSAAMGWTLGTCRRIEWDNPTTPANPDCQKNFWRYDPDTPNPNFMTACGAGCTANYRFYEAQTRRIVHVLNQYSLTNTLMDTVGAGTDKGILIRFNLREGVFTELYSKEVNGFPKLGLQEGPFRVDVYTGAGALLYTFNIWDPRIAIGAQNKGPGEVITDNVNFTIIFPYSEEAKTLEIRDRASNELQASVDIPESLKMIKKIIFLPLILR